MRTFRLVVSGNSHMAPNISWWKNCRVLWHTNKPPFPLCGTQIRLLFLCCALNLVPPAGERELRPSHQRCWELVSHPGRTSGQRAMSIALQRGGTGKTGARIWFTGCINQSSEEIFHCLASKEKYTPK